MTPAPQLELSDGYKPDSVGLVLIPEIQTSLTTIPLETPLLALLSNLPEDLALAALKRLPI